MIDRRVFLGILGLALAPHPAAGQQPGKVVRIGFLTGGAVSWESDTAASFRDELRRLGWVEGKNITFEHRSAAANADRLSALVAELLRLKVDLIVVASTPGALAAKAATSVIPIVFTMVSDPVASGVVASLARPGGNITGWSNMLPETSRKLLELLKEVDPTVSRVAVLFSPENPGKLLEIKVLQAEARRTGLILQTMELRGPGDITAAFSAMAKARADGLVVLQDAVTGSNRKVIVESAARARVPAIYQVSEFVDLGGLVSYGMNVVAQFRRSALYVDKILRGARPGDLPVEQPTTFELVVNMKTARALGITMPRSVLLRAERVIE